MFKRWMSALLAIAMCVSMLPTAAFAAEVEEPEASTTAVVEAAETEAAPEPETEPEQKPEPETEAAETEAPAQTEPSAETAAAETEETEVPAETEEAEETEAAEPAVTLCAHGVEVCRMCALEARIAALPEAEALAALTAGEKEALAAELEALVEAYDALSAEEQALVSNIDKLVEVYQTFQGMMVMTTEELGANPQVFLKVNGQTEYFEADNYDPITLDVEIQDIPKSLIQSLTYNVSYWYNDQEEEIHKDTNVELASIWEENGVLRASISYTPAKGGHYSFTADVTLTNSQEYHDYRNMCVRAGLWLNGVDVREYNIHVGDEETFDPVLVGNVDELESITYTLYRIENSSGTWLKVDGFTPIVRHDSQSVSCVCDEVGTYGMRAELRTTAGAIWSADSNWFDVKNDDTLGMVRIVDGMDEVACGDEVKFSVNVDGLDVKEILWQVYPLDCSNEVVDSKTTTDANVTFAFPNEGKYVVTAKITTESGEVYYSPTAVSVHVHSGVYTAWDLVQVDGKPYGNKTGDTVTMRPDIFNGTPAQVVGLVRDEDGKELFRETLEPDENGYYSFSFTFPKAGWYDFNAIVTNEKGEEFWPGWGFMVTPWGDYENGPTLSIDKFEYWCGETVIVHADVPGADQLKDVYYVVYSRSDDKETRYDYEGDLVLTPEKGGDYHVKLVVEYRNDWYDEFGHLDFQVCSGMWLVGLTCDAENGAIPVGGSVTFTVLTGGEDTTDGTATYDFRLYKFADNEEGRELVGERLGQTSKSVTFQIKTPGFYHVEVEMRNNEGALYRDGWGEVKVGAVLYYVSTAQGNYGVNDTIEVLTELENETDDFVQLRFELYRWEDGALVQVAEPQRMTRAEYLAESRRPVLVSFPAPEGGWKAGVYHPKVFVEYTDGTALENRYGERFNVVNGKRISGLEISNENPVVGETVTVTPSFAGEGSIKSIRYELYHEGTSQGELEGGENGCSFQVKWSGNWEVDATFVNDKDEEGTVGIACQALYIYLDPEFKYDVADGDNFQIKAQIKDEWDRVVEEPAGNLTYEYRILDIWEENVLYAGEKTGENTFTWTPTGPGTYNAEVKVYRDYDESVLEETRTFSVGRRDVLRGMNASAEYAPVGSSVTFTPITVGEVDGYIYRIYKRVDGRMQDYYQSEETKDGDFTYTFTEPGTYACQVEVKVNGASFLDGVSLQIYEGRFATRVLVDQEVINIDDSVSLDLKTEGSGDIGTVTYRIFRDEYLAGDLEQEITVTGGKTAASYVPKFGGSYWIEAEVDDGNGGYRVAENARITVRQGRSLEGAELVTWPVFVDEEAKFQLKLNGEGENGTINAYLWESGDWDSIDRPVAVYEDITVDEKGQIALTFDRTGYFNLELWMINENGDRYVAWNGFDVHDRSETIAHWLEMYNDFGFTDARVNTPIDFYLHIIGDEENIARINYYVYYCETYDEDKAVQLEQFCQMGTTSLDFSFTPDKTGYYWVGAELEDKAGNLSFGGWTECTVSDTRGLRAKLSAPTVDGYAYKINGTITVTAQYEGTKPYQYRMRVTRYDRDFQTGEEFYNEVVPYKKAQTSPTFTFKPAQMGYYMVEIELLDKKGAIIGHSCAYSVLVMGGDVEPAGAEPERYRYTVGEDVTVNFTYKNENLGEVKDVEFVYRWYSIDENGEFTVEGLKRQIASPADKNSFTFTPEAPGLYSVSVFIRTAQGNYMGYGTDDYIEVLPKEAGLRAGDLEMIDGGRYYQAKVNSEVSFHLNTEGVGEIGKIRYEVCYCKNDNFILRELADEFTQTGDSLDFTFTPNKAGYYWVKAVLTNGEGVVSASDSVKLVVSATDSVAMELSKPDRADGYYSAGKAITITAKYAGTKPKSYKLTVIRDNAELKTFTGNDDVMKEFKAQANPVFKYTPTATGHYQFLLEVVTADNVTLRSFAYVPVVGADKHMSAITFEYDEYNVYDNVTAYFTYEGEGEITDMRIWAGNDTTGELVADQYIVNPTEEQQKSFTFTPKETGVYGITVFAHNSDGSLWELSNTGAVQVLAEGEETHWYHLEIVEPKEATEEGFGTKGYQYYTCAKDGHGNELFSYPDRTPMEQEELDALEVANRVYFKGGEIEIQKVTDTGNVPLSSIELVDMAVEPTMKLEGVRTPEAFTQQGVTWSSSSTAIATVDADGNVEFKKPGTVTITATATDGGGVKQSVKFTVYFRCQATAIVAKLADTTNLFGTVNPTKVGVQVGDNVNLVVTGKNDEVTLEPEYLTYKVVSGKARVDENGVLTALGTGTAKIEISITGDPLKRKTTLSVKLVAMVPDACGLTYTDENSGAKLSDGYISPEGFVEENGGITLYAIKSGSAKYFYIGAKAFKTALGNEGILQAGQFTWTSSNKSVKVVEGADGYAKVTIPANTAIEAGKCVITATSKQNKNVSQSFQVVVIDFMPKLEKTSITFNTYLAVSAETIGLTSVPGNEVRAVTLQEYNAKTKTYAPCTDMSADYENGLVTITAQNDLPNATRKLRLLAETAHWDAAALDFTVVIKNVLPTVTVKQTVKVNLGTFDSAGTLTVTAKLGKENVKVTNVVLNPLAGKTIGYTLGGDMDPEKPYVCPVELVDSALGTKGTLVIHLEGYSKSVDKAFTVVTENKAAAGTLNTYMVYDPARVGSFVEVPLPEGLTGDVTVSDGSLTAKKAGSGIHIYAEDIITKGGARKVTVTVGDVSRTVNVTVKNVAPKVTVTQTKKVNQLDKASVGLLTITAMNGKEVLELGNVTLAPTSSTAKLGYVLGKTEAGFTLTHTDPMNIAATKGTLTIPVVGYHYVTSKAFTVAVEKVVDKGVLSPAKVTMYQKLPGMAQVVALESYWESTEIDWEKTEIKAGGTTGVYTYLDVKKEDGKLQVSFREGADQATMKAGTATYTITPYTTDGTKLAAVKLTVVVSTALPKATIKPTTVKLSKSQAVPAELTVTAGETGSYELSRFGIDNENFTVTKDTESGKFLVAIADGYDPKAGSYTVKLTPVYANQGTEVSVAAVTLKITVAN